MDKKNLFCRKTKRLQIRPLAEDDYQAWRNAYTSILPQRNKWDRATNRTSGELSKTKFRALLKEQALKRKTEEFCDYAVFLDKTGEYIGRVSLMNFGRSITQSAFVGYALFNPYWGKGYAEEAVHALINIAFKEHKLHRVVAGIEPDNKRSIKLAIKLNFRKEGIARRVVLLRGEWQDLVQYALTSEDLKIKWSGKIGQRKT
ncbi:MAG: GNAT family N-acetyltransferase [Pseudobdellovibrionaceae bacterium]